MTNERRLNLLTQLAECGYSMRLPNGEERFVDPDVFFTGEYYSFAKGDGNPNKWLVDKKGNPTATNELDQIGLDSKLTSLAVKWGIIKEIL